MTDTEKRIKELSEIIYSAKRCYYNGDDEKLLTDTEYDLVEEELKRLDPTNPALSFVGSDPNDADEQVKVVHKVPMLSMDKIHTVEDLERWYRINLSILGVSKEVLIEPKLDGISGELLYKDGNFIQASTRGNGTVGLEINTDYLTCIPASIPTTKSVVRVRGEFIIPKSFAEKLGADSDAKSLRNICSGAIKRKDDCPEKRAIKFVSYQLVVDAKDDYKTEEDRLKFLIDSGFDVVQYFKADNDALVWKTFENYQAVMRETWWYETDGLIVVFNDIATQDLIRAERPDTPHHHNYSIAIKPTPLGKWSTLLDVEFNTSRTGKVVPVGLLAPVKIGPVMVDRVTLNNMSFIESNDIKIGDRILCVRSNDVIPKFSERIHTSDSRDIVCEECPACKSKLIRVGPDLKCTNYKSCPAQFVNRFIHWFDVNGIKNLGPAMVEALVNNGHITAIWQLYSMKEQDLAIMVEKFCGLNKETDTMREFLKTFNDSKDITFQELLGRYGIPGIGLKAVEKLGIKSLADLVIYKDPKYVVSSVAIEKYLYNWLTQDQSNFDDLFSLVKFVKPKNEIKPKEEKNYFCITGTFTNCKRDTVVKTIEENYSSWKFSPTVNKGVSLLIVGNEPGLTNKSIAATKLKIPMVHIDGDFNLDSIKEYL